MVVAGIVMQPGSFAWSRKSSVQPVFDTMIILDDLVSEIASHNGAGAEEYCVER